jgi:dTDP-glucose 4,6-dehydratase
MPIYKPKIVLITGGAGFVGSNFVNFTLNNHPDTIVISFDKLTYAGNLDNLKNTTNHSNHIFVRGDINDSNIVSDLLHKYEIDTVVHFAAESHVDNSVTQPSTFIQTNVIGTFTLLEAVRNFWLIEKKWDADNCRFHHVSTNEVFGEIKRNSSPENVNCFCIPSSPYSASKAAADQLVYAHFRTYGLPVSLSHCSNNYGPHQHHEKLIPFIIKSCIEQKPITIYGNGSNIRNWLYVEDHCSAIWMILTMGKIGEFYNVGSDCELDNLSLAKMICALMDKKLPASKPYESLITFVPDRPGHDFKYLVNTDKIKKELHWMPKYNLENGLALTIDYYLHNI